MKNIILYDDVCNLCSFSIQFIIKHDSQCFFHFTSIKSTLGQVLMNQYHLDEIDSLVLIQKNQAFIYSDAVLYIARGLQSWHRHLYFFRFFPKKLRDIIYRMIAKYRYNLFGKRQSCMMLTTEIEHRFLD